MAEDSAYCNRCGLPHPMGRCGRPPQQPYVDDNADRRLISNDLHTVALRTRIFAALWNHDSYYYVDDTTVACCFCGETFDENGKQAHLTDVLIRDLGDLIAPQYHCVMPDGSTFTP